MNLNQAPAEYDPTDEAQVRRTLEIEDKKNLKAGQILDKLLFRDTVTGTIVTLTVASGVVVIT